MASSRVTGEYLVIEVWWIISRWLRHRVASSTHRILMRPAMKMVGSIVREVVDRNASGISNSTIYSGSNKQREVSESLSRIDHADEDGLLTMDHLGHVYSGRSMCWVRQ